MDRKVAHDLKPPRVGERSEPRKQSRIRVRGRFGLVRACNDFGAPAANVAEHARQKSKHRGGDGIARSLSVYELPVGVVTNILGAAFFFYLLATRDVSYSTVR